MSEEKECIGYNSRQIVADLRTKSFFQCVLDYLPDVLNKIGHTHSYIDPPKLAGEVAMPLSMGV